MSQSVDYEKVGRFIYGTQRLGSLLSILVMWFDSGTRDASSIGEATFAEKSEIAHVYFEKNGTSPQIRQLFFDYLAEVESLKLSINDQLSDRLTTPSFEQDIKRMHAAHTSFGKLIQELGFTGVSQDVLRDLAAQP